MGAGNCSVSACGDVEHYCFMFGKSRFKILAWRQALLLTQTFQHLIYLKTSNDNLISRPTLLYGTPWTVSVYTAVNNLQYITSNDCMTVSNKLENMWGEAIVITDNFL